MYFIDLEHMRGLAIPNVFTRDYERMVVFGHYNVGRTCPPGWTQMANAGD